MDLIHTLLSFFLSVAAAASIALHSLIAGHLSTDQKIIITPPPAHSIVATTSSQKIIGTTTPAVSAVKPKQTPAKPVSAPVVSTAAPADTSPSPTPSISADALNTQTRGALVNILCLSGGSGNVHSISGSGVFIDTRGVILTNAHVAQYFLLKDYPSQNNVDCTIRTGSPAQPQYHATLLYLPPAWVSNNADQITAEEAKGTGEDDYAFLLVTGSTGPSPLPATFPAIPMALQEPDFGESAFLAAYPAGFLDGTNIEKNLYISSAYAKVKQLFTFNDTSHIDLVSVGGTIVSQGGSSGGAMVRASDGKLQGIITTDTSATTTAERDLRAITLAHIQRSLAAYGQGSIPQILTQDVVQAAANFAANIAPGEKSLLVQVLQHK